MLGEQWQLQTRVSDHGVLDLRVTQRLQSETGCETKDMMFGLFATDPQAASWSRRALATGGTVRRKEWGLFSGFGVFECSVYGVRVCTCVRVYVCAWVCSGPPFLSHTQTCPHTRDSESAHVSES